MKERLVLWLNWLLPGRLQAVKSLLSATIHDYRIELFGVTAPICFSQMVHMIANAIRAGCGFRQFYGTSLPPAGKAWTIGKYREISGYQVFIETGTSHGATIEAVAPIFRQCFTIEISEELSRQTHRRLWPAFSHVQFISGDSPSWLARFLRDLTEPAIIWLDAHYSVPPAPEDPTSPLRDELLELERYLQKARHLILIDDARGLDIPPDVFQQFLDQARKANYVVICRDDIYRLVPNELFP